MEYTRERAMEWLNKHWHSHKACPICLHNNWTISDSVGVMLPASESSIDIGGLAYPLFLLTCGTCGYTLFFNAVVAGLTTKAPVPDEKRYTPPEEKKEA
jgi:hypothetical protein